jgi:hypothetical protein
MLLDEANELIGGLLHGDPSPYHVLRIEFISSYKLKLGQYVTYYV